MSCYHPNIVTYCPSGFRGSDGKLQFTKDGKLVTHKFQGAGFEEVLEDGTIAYRLENKVNTFCLKDDLSTIDSNGEYSYSMMVPCQQCYGCRIDYSKHWADRIVMEQLISPPGSCYFVTLTYDDDHLYLECATGKQFEKIVDGEPVIINGATLVKKHVQDFIKRLRFEFSSKYGHDGIRYFCAGEYGSKTFRPHYHICFFNLPLFDLEKYANNFRGDILYNSETLSRLWGKGYVVIGDLNWESAAYTARYVVKKFKGKESEEFYHAHGDVLPEFSLCSRRPGLAGVYFDKEVENIYRHDCIQLPSTKNRAGRTSVPRYFDKLLEKYIEAHPDTEFNLEKIKFERRELAEKDTYNRRILSGLFDKEYFKLKEESFKKSISVLNRENLINSLDF